MTSSAAEMAVPVSARWWNDQRWRGVIYQILLLLAVAFIAGFLVTNTVSNLHQRHIATGLGFMQHEAGFDISEHPIPYSNTDTYLRAFVVGLLNTIKVSVAGIILATLLGMIMGVARLSGNWLVARLATIYVESVRNVPVLLQLFLWYEIITQVLPGTRRALSVFGVAFLSNRGARVPWPDWNGAWTAVLIALLLGIALSILIARESRRRHETLGHPLPVGWISLALIIGSPVVVALASGGTLPVEVPHLAGFDFNGGAVISPEFAALLLGLVIYTGAFIAEIVRGGIMAVAIGQSEAAEALGLSRGQTLRLVVLPQAMRVILPPLTNQYLNLTKNSTLAVAIGFPDLVSVSNTAINQTGQAVEGVTIIMVVYLVISLVLSAAMNLYNKRVALRGGSR
jgi:general L-amino acid transport system permease protein